MLGRTFFILVAITLDIIFASTFTREISRLFSVRERSFPFFSISVIKNFIISRSFLFSKLSKVSVSDSSKVILPSQHIFCSSESLGMFRSSKNDSVLGELSIVTVVSTRVVILYKTIVVRTRS